MVKVPTQNFVVNFFTGAILSSFWWYVTRDLIYKLFWMVEDPSNFVEVQDKGEADDADSEETNN